MKKRCVVALIQGPEDTLLMGMRNDTNKWTMPAGHCEKGEDPHTALVREVKEETGLDVKDAKLVQVTVTESQVAVFIFVVKVDPKQDIDTSKDPDKEFDHLTYEDPFDRVHELHIPLRNNLGFQYWAHNL